MSFESRVRELWPDAADKVLGIVRGQVEPTEVAQTQAWVASCDSAPSRLAQKMHAIDILIGGSGCEAIFEAGEKWPDMEYVNMGETYAPTIVLDYTEHKFSVTSWGAWIERAQSRGRTYS